MAKMLCPHCYSSELNCTGYEDRVNTRRDCGYSGPIVFELEDEDMLRELQRDRKDHPM